MEKGRKVIGLLLCLALAIAVAIGVSGCVTEKYSYLELYGTYKGEIERTNADGAVEKKGYELKLYLDGTYEANEIKGDGKGKREYGSFRFSPIALENYRITMKAEVAVDGNGCAEETNKSVFGSGALTHVQIGDNAYGLESEGIKLERTADEAEDTMRSNVLLGAFGGTISDDTIEITVEESVDRVKVGDFLYFSPETDWSVYYDEKMKTKITSKIARLDRGNTELYLTVGDEDGYVIDFYREYENPVVFVSEGKEVGSIKVAPNGEIAEEDVPKIERTGYELVGWKDEAGKLWQFGKEAVAIDGAYDEYTFVAEWKAKTYNAALKVGEEVFGVEEVIYGSTYEFPTPEKEGHTFLGWSDGVELVSDKNGNGTDIWLFAEDKEFTAEWAKKKYTVTVVGETADGGTYQGYGEYEYGDEAEITVTTQNGYTFAGWYADGEKISEEKTVRIFIGDGDKVLTAKYEEYFFEIAVNGASGNVSVIRERKESGTEVVPVITDIPEGIWDGWYENNEKISEEFEYSFIMPKADKRIEARWIASGVRTVAEFTEKIALNENIELAADIDFGGAEWTVVPEYYGEIDGKGFALRNITVNKTYEESGVEYAGLFGLFGGTVYDVAFENISVEVSASNQLFAGLFAARVELSGMVRNVTVSGNLNVSTGTGFAYIGGFAGENQGEISNVSVNCEMNISQSGEPNAEIHAGGFVGHGSDWSVITDCDVSGVMKINYSANGNTTVTTDDFAAVTDDFAELENNVSDIVKDIKLES